MTTLRQRTAILALGDFTNTGLIAVIAIALTRLLTKQEYGTYRQVLLAYGVIVVFLGSQISESLLYYLVRAAKKHKPLWLSQTVLLSLTAGAIGSGLILVAAESWARWTGNPELATLMRIFALYPLADRLATLVPTGLIAADRPGSAAGFTLVLGLTRVFSAVVPAALGQPLTTIFWTMNLSWLMVAVAGIGWLQFRTKIGWALPSFRTTKEQIAYVTPLLIASALAAAHEQFGQLLASATLSTADYADYAVGAVRLPWVGVWTATIASALMPDLVARGALGDRAGLVALWHRGVRKGALVVFPSVAVILAIAPDFIRTVYGVQYSRAAWPFSIFLLALIPRVTNYGVVFRALGNTTASLLFTGIGLVANVAVALGLSLLANGSHLKFIAPAIGYAAGYYVTIVVTLILMSRHTSLPMVDLVPGRLLFPLAGLSVVCGALAFVTRLFPIGEWNSATPEIAAAVRCCVAGTVFLITFLGGGFFLKIFTTDERESLLAVPCALWPTRGSRD